MPALRLPRIGGPVGAAARRALNRLAPLLGFGVFIGLWYAMHHWILESVFDKPAFLVTEPHRVVQESFLDPAARTELLTALGWTTTVAMTGLVISITVGTTFAVLMAQAGWIERTFWPFLVAAQAMPILAIVPILGSIFGFGFSTRIVVCVIISLFPIVSNTLFGLLSADANQHDLFTLHGVGRWRRLVKLQFPSALPAIFAGFRIAGGLSVIGAVVGELFFRRGGKGIGILMDQYRSRLMFPETYGALILAAALGITVFVVFTWLARKATGHWYEASRSGRR